jgi:hypothetical protein
VGGRRERRPRLRTHHPRSSAAPRPLPTRSTRPGPRVEPPPAVVRAVLCFRIVGRRDRCGDCRVRRAAPLPPPDMPRQPRRSR